MKNRKFSRILSLVLLCSLLITSPKPVLGMEILKQGCAKLFEMILKSPQAQQIVFAITTYLASNKQIKKEFVKDIHNCQETILQGKGSESIKNIQESYAKLKDRIATNLKNETEIQPDSNTKAADGDNIQQASMFKAIADCYFSTKKNASLEQEKHAFFKPQSTQNDRDKIFTKKDQNIALGKEQFYEHDRILQHQAYIKKLKDDASKWGQAGVAAFFLIRDIAYESRKISKEIAQENDIDTHVCNEMRANPLFAIAYSLALQEIFDTIANAISGKNQLFYLVKLNTLSLPGTPGIALSEFIEKLNTQYFNKDGDLNSKVDLSKIAQLVNFYLKSTSGTIEEYIKKLTDIFAKSNIREFADYIEDAQVGDVKLAKNNGFIRFCKKLKERLISWGAISRETIVNNKQQKMFLSFLEHCQKDINDPKLKTFLDDYHKLYGDNYYYSDMCRLYDQYKQHAQKKNNQPQEINLTPKVPATVFNGAGPGPDRTAQQNSGIATNKGKNLKLSEIVAKIREKYTPKISMTEQNSTTNNCANEPALPALPEVKPVELPDKGGCINTPELPNQGTICPTPTNEPFPKSCGTGQLPVVIPEGLNLPPQTMPSLGGGMGLGDNNNPPEPAPKAPNPEPGKVTEVKPESKTEEADKEKEKQNKPKEVGVDAEKVKQKKIEEYEQAIQKLEETYSAEGVQEAVDNLKVTHEDVVNNGTKLIEQIKAEAIKVCELKGIAVFKDGYYYINGFKFTEYYYQRTFSTGRPYPTLVAKEILKNPKVIEPHVELIKHGYYWYKTDDWEMIYNPATKEIQHIQQIKKKNNDR